MDECLDYILKQEGGYSNHPFDRGGTTNKGITQRTYNAYLMSNQLPLRSVEEIDSYEVSEIYKKYFWDLCKCSELPVPLDLIVLDSAVQHGPARANKWLQRCVGEMSDGIIGDKTLYAVKDKVINKRLEDVIDNYINGRIAFYAQIIKNDPTQEMFAKNWKNRIDSLLREIGKMNEH
jgi:lysozyme family protein